MTAQTSGETAASASGPTSRAWRASGRADTRSNMVVIVPAGDAPQVDWSLFASGGTTRSMRPRKRVSVRIWNVRNPSISVFGSSVRSSGPIARGIGKTGSEGSSQVTLALIGITLPDVSAPFARFRSKRRNDERFFRLVYTRVA